MYYLKNKLAFILLSNYFILLFKDIQYTISTNYNVLSYTIYIRHVNVKLMKQINGDDPINAWVIANNSVFGRKQYRFSGLTTKQFKISLRSYIRVR